MLNDLRRTNRYTVYMIKPAFQNIDAIVTSEALQVALVDIGTFVFARSQVRPPSWMQDFFGSMLDANIGMLTSSAKALLLIPVTRSGGTTYFAVSFGFGRHLLDDGVIEERFGLKVVLNSLDTTSLRSIDKTTLGSVPKQTREQMSRDVAAADFGIDIEQDLISSVTGKSKDAALGGLIAGKDALTGSARVNISNVAGFLSHCLDRYRSDDYKRGFEWIDQIAELRDRSKESDLNRALVEKLNNRNLDKAWMAVPEVVNWSDICGFRYIRAKRSNLYTDLDLGDFLTELDDSVTIETLKDQRVFVISASEDDVLENWSAFRCIYAEMTLQGDVYILNSGKWYKIAGGFTQQVQHDFNAIVRANIPLPDCSMTDEGEYNQFAAQALSNACCMDRKLITYGGGHSSIEFCDILTSDKKLLHIKRYGGSSVFSHLFAQGAISGELFVSDPTFRTRLDAKLPAGFKLSDPELRPEPKDYEIVYGIISEQITPLELPFFSKVSIRTAKRRLEGFGYKVSLKQIRRIPQATSRAQS